MRKFLLPLSLFLLVLSFAGAASAQSLNQGKSISLPIVQTINSDYFAAGEQVVLSGTVNGDAYLAGGQIIVEGVVNGDLLIAGGNISVTGIVKNNIRAVGGQLTINGEVDGNVTLAGGNLTIGNSAVIKGSLTAAGGMLQVYGPINGNIVAGVGQLTIASSVKGNINTGVGSITTTPNSLVAGNLNYWTDEERNINLAGTVNGRVYENIYEDIWRSKKAVKFESPVQPLKILMGVGLGLKLFGLLSLLLIGSLLIKFAPFLISETSNLITTNPLRNLGVGFIAVIVFPLLFVVSLLLVISAPLGFISLAAFCITTYTAKIFAIYNLGQRLLKKLTGKVYLYWGLTFGLFVYALVSIVPIVGWFFGTYLTLTGIGALLIRKRDLYTKLRKNKLI